MATRKQEQGTTQPATTAVRSQIHVPGEETTFIVKGKDAILIIGFCIYVGVTVTTFAFAKGELNELKQGNKELSDQLKIIDLKVEKNQGTLDALWRSCDLTSAKKGAEKSN